MKTLIATVLSAILLTACGTTHEYTNTYTDGVINITAAQEACYDKEWNNEKEAVANGTPSKTFGTACGTEEQTKNFIEGTYHVE